MRTEDWPNLILGFAATALGLGSVIVTTEVASTSNFYFLIFLPPWPGCQKIHFGSSPVCLKSWPQEWHPLTGVRNWYLFWHALAFSWVQCQTERILSLVVFYAGPSDYQTDRRGKEKRNLPCYWHSSGLCTPWPCPAPWHPPRKIFLLLPLNFNSSPSVLFPELLIKCSAVTELTVNVLARLQRRHCGTIRKCWYAAFSL